MEPNRTPDTTGMKSILAAGIVELGRALEAGEQAGDSARGDAYHVKRIRQAHFELAEAVEKHDTLTEKLTADERLSAEGKAERLGELREGLRGNLSAILEGARNEAGELERRTEYTPPRLAADPLEEQARLDTARSDARMILDTRDAQHLADHLRDLAEQDTERDMRHLLLHTSWPDRYLRARDPHGHQASVWREYRDRLMDRYLTGEQRGRYLRSKGWRRHGARAMTILENAAGFALMDRGARGES